MPLMKSQLIASLMLMFSVAATPMAAQQETILADFGTTPTSGQYSVGGLVRDSAGNLYGVTSNGGPNGGPVGNGTVFEVSPTANGEWTTKYIYGFGAFRDDGLSPFGGLVMDRSGNLYGTTTEGGTKKTCGDGWDNFGCGTVFELSPNDSGTWTETILYNFRSNSGDDGYFPVWGLTMDSEGNLYGLTKYGGGPNVDLNGTAFELRRSSAGKWTERVLHRFGHGTIDGIYGFYPEGPLVFDKSGNLYGVLPVGGDSPGGKGIVFELAHTANGWKENMVFNFNSDSTGKSGNGPLAGLIFDDAGNLYGTTYAGGTYGAGNVFQLTPKNGGNWSLTVLHSFSQEDPAGDYPQNPLVLDSAGNLYGTTDDGSSPAGGTAFKLQPSGNGSWMLTVLHSFGNFKADGKWPSTALIFDPSGNLYGATYAGGTGGNNLNGLSGTVFEITP